MTLRSSVRLDGSNLSVWFAHARSDAHFAQGRLGRTAAAVRSAARRPDERAAAPWSAAPLVSARYEQGEPVLLALHVRVRRSRLCSRYQRGPALSATRAHGSLSTSSRSEADAYALAARRRG